ncbi:transcriptional regulator [Elasticomyces elasticus]|nr:transcriptional regulator [Elasticomyces elasticus]
MVQHAICEHGQLGLPIIVRRGAAPGHSAFAQDVATFLAPAAKEGRRKGSSVQAGARSQVQLLGSVDEAEHAAHDAQRITFSDGKGSKTGMRGLSNLLVQLRKLCNHPFVFEEVEGQMNLNRVTNDMIWRTSGPHVLPDDGHHEHHGGLYAVSWIRRISAFCCQLARAGGLGMHLQSADTVIIHDLDWSPQQVLQAQDRAPRMKQKNEVRVLRLITSNSVEKKVLARAQSKLDMDGKVIQAEIFDNMSTTEERDEVLRVMLESAEAAEAAMEHDETDDDDLNVIMARTDGELELFRENGPGADGKSAVRPGKDAGAPAWREGAARYLHERRCAGGGRAGVQLRPWSWRAQGREIRRRFKEE